MRRPSYPQMCLILSLMCCGLSPLIAADEPVKVKVGEISLAVPKHWKQQPPANRLRLAQFSIPAADGDQEAAELSIFNFGAGGTIGQQIERWKRSFDAQGRKFTATEGKSSVGEYVLVDLGGTYRKPVGPPVLRKTEPLPNARMLVVMIAVPEKGNYFLKLVGPAGTVDSNAEAFRSSFGAAAKDEKPLKEEEER